MVFWETTYGKLVFFNRVVLITKKGLNTFK